MFLHPAGITPTPASGRCALRHWRGEGCPGALEAADTACLGLLKGDLGHSSSALIPREHPTHLRPGLLVGTADRSPKLGLAIEGVYFSSCFCQQIIGTQQKRWGFSSVLVGMVFFWLLGWFFGVFLFVCLYFLYFLVLMNTSLLPHFVFIFQVSSWW